MGKINFILFFATLLVFTYCKKDSKTHTVEPEPTPIIQPIPAVTPTVTPGPGNPHQLVISFKAMVNNQVLVPNTKFYTNKSQDNFSITKFNYYISNVQLTKEDGTIFAEKESYHLIKHVGGSTSFTIVNLPEGNYKNVRFLIGVDSLRNVSGAQTGALDVLNDMFWEWNSGYIFFKMEGSYNTTATPTIGDYAIHIGGFSGPLKCLQTCSFNLSSPIVSKKDKVSTLSYNTVIDEIFVNPNYIDFETYYAAVNTKTFKQISDNYKDMFVVEKVEN